MIDTNYFVEKKFDTETIIFKDFKSMIDEGQGTFLFNDVLIGEYKNNLAKLTNYTKEKFKEFLADKSTINVLIQMFGVNSVNEKVENYEEQYLIPFKEKFDRYLEDIKGIDTTIENIDLKSIIGNYLDSNPPFEVNKAKKNEFPDAIIFESVKDWMSKESNFDKLNDSVYIVTKDKGLSKAFVDFKDKKFRNMNSHIYDPAIKNLAGVNLFVVEDLKDCLIISVLEQELEDKIKENIDSDEFTNFLNEALNENLKDYLWEEELNVSIDSSDAEAMEYSVLQSKVNVHKLLSAHKDGKTLKLIIEISDATIRLEVEYVVTDEGSGYYDKETGVSFGMDSFDKTMEIEADLKINLEMSLDESGIFGRRIVKNEDDIENEKNPRKQNELTVYEYREDDLSEPISLEIENVEINKESFTE
ncbi:PIN domain-containing protein [Listeria booriae]|uniref:PIN domain-containing protein n=1 Tax=Listeria booriae TaxID=1552123 RepID=UPI001624EC8C|nr:PIN domain-containing protein [Listeria booriae]MBC2324594.1 DUF4935 domain-containing protein [Listeria booriae]